MKVTITLLTALLSAGAAQAGQPMDNWMLENVGLPIIVPANTIACMTEVLAAEQAQKADIIAGCYKVGNDLWYRDREYRGKYTLIASRCGKCVPAVTEFYVARWSIKG